jgi:hypothetical protein
MPVVTAAASTAPAHAAPANGLDGSGCVRHRPGITDRGRSAPVREAAGLKASGTVTLQAAARHRRCPSVPSSAPLAPGFGRPRADRRRTAPEASSPSTRCASRHPLGAGQIDLPSRRRRRTGQVERGCAGARHHHRRRRRRWPSSPPGGHLTAGVGRQRHARVVMPNTGSRAAARSFYFAGEPGRPRRLHVHPTSGPQGCKVCPGRRAAGAQAPGGRDHRGGKGRAAASGERHAG